MDRVQALGIDVPDDLLRRWSRWFAPACQPFLVPPPLLSSLVGARVDVALEPELRDTYGLYRRGDETGQSAVAWLIESDFSALPEAIRAALVRAQHAMGRELVPTVRRWGSVVGPSARGQADGHRFVWWPSNLERVRDEVLVDYVEEGRRPSRHREVGPSVWAVAASLLPQARRLAGTFPHGSGPNCFGTVMAAAGIAGADEIWMQREPFERWLSETTRPGGDDDLPGTVLVWRSPAGLVDHAAVTLGGGWALHKPSQGWMSPTKVLTVEDCRASSRGIGRRLERHTLRLPTTPGRGGR